jgi:UDP-glucose 4-epimerase
MTVLVTGGAGFIGSRLVERLLAQGRRVVALDDLTKGTTANVRDLLGREGFGLEIGDVRDEAVLKRVAGLASFDTVFHLAAMHYIPECAARPAETLSVNVVGTQALLDKLPCRRFLFASTGDVYAAKDGSHREDDALQPFSVYGLSKLFGERLLEAASRVQEGTTFVVARIFNTYGSRDTNPHVIPQIMEGIRSGNGLRLGNLSPKRDYISVEDTVDGLLALEAFQAPSTFEVFNVGTGMAASVREVVALLSEILRTRLDVEIDTERVRPVDRPHLQAEITKIRRATGWQPKYSLREGLKQLCLAEGLMG